MSLSNLIPDLIDPIDGFFGRIFHGPMHRFTFSIESGISGVKVEKILQQYGVRIWGREMTSETERAFLVKKTQAIWAEYLLCRADIPLTSPLLDPRNADYAQRHEADTMPEPWTEEGIGPHTLVDHAVDWLVRLTGR